MKFGTSSKLYNESDTDSTSETSTAASILVSQIVFYLYLIVDIPSVLCSLILFYYFLHLPELRQQHYAHQIMLYPLFSAFLITAIDIPLILAHLKDKYYITSMKNPESFCIFWIIYDDTLWSINLWMLALLSLERYLLIFFKPLVMKNKKRRFCLYYVPVVVVVPFIFFWNVYLVAMYPCTEIQFEFTTILCGAPCYQNEASKILLNFDWIISGLVPVFLTVLFTLLLILHVLYQRHKIRRHLAQLQTWKRTRKMFLQLLPITSIFLFFTMPVIIVGLLALSDPWYSTTLYFYINFLTYFLPLFAPFAILSKQKVIQRRLLALFCPRRFNQIMPVMRTANSMRAVNIHAARKVPANIAPSIHS